MLIRAAEPDAAGYPAVTAEIEGATVGTARATRHRERAGYRWAVDVSVHVHPDHRRHGIGRALYLDLLHDLRKRGFRVACTAIVLPNDAAVALHQSLGFERIGTFERIAHIDSEPRDVGWWELELSPVRAAAPGSDRHLPPAEPDLAARSEPRPDR